MTNNELAPVIQEDREAFKELYDWEPTDHPGDQRVLQILARHRTRTASGEGEGSLAAELADLRQQKADYWPAKICGCGHDHPDDVCLYHRNIVLASVAPPSELREALEASQDLIDELSDIIQPIHWETWKAALFSDQEEWPDEDDQQMIVAGVDDIAVLEHWDAWGREIVNKVAALVARQALSSTKAEIGGGAIREAAAEFQRIVCSGPPHSSRGRHDDWVDEFNAASERLTAALKHSEGA